MRSAHHKHRRRTAIPSFMVFYQGTVEATPLLLLDNFACNNILLPNKYLSENIIRFTWNTTKFSVPLKIYIYLFYLCVFKRSVHISIISERQLLRSSFYTVPFSKWLHLHPLKFCSRIWYMAIWAPPQLLLHSSNKLWTLYCVHN